MYYLYLPKAITMFDHAHLVESILDSPLAPDILSDLQDRLEQERKRRVYFYNEVSEHQKAEFINGEIVVHSPVMKAHNSITGNLYMIFDMYCGAHDLGFVGVEKILIRLTRNDYEPDVCFFRKEVAQDFTDEQTLFPAPEFIVEVLSKGTEARDRGIKFRDYALHGVTEYWLVAPESQMIEQYILKDGEYQLHFKSDNGLVNCRSLPGLSFPVETIFDKVKTRTFVKGL